MGINCVQIKRLTMLTKITRQTRLFIIELKKIKHQRNDEILPAGRQGV